MKIKIQPFKIIPVLCFLLSLYSHAQIEFYYGNSEEAYEINQNTNPEILKAFLKKHKATAIEFNSNTSSRFPLRLKNKKGNWTLFDIEDNAVFMPKQSKKYSFKFPDKHQEKKYFTWATRKNKTYWVDLENETVETKMAFDEVRISIKKDTVLFDSGHEDIYEITDKIAVRSGSKWGVIEPGEYNEPSFYLSRDFLYNSPEDVPHSTGFSSDQLRMMESIREDYNVDLLVALDEHGYYFKGRNKKDKFYGLFVGEGEVSGTIPTKYDNIKRHRNPETFEVWKNGKVGYYNSNFELVKEPIFDEFHFMHLDYTYGCALKKDGFWQLYDSFDGSLLVEGKAITIEALQELWLNRH